MGLVWPMSTENVNILTGAMVAVIPSKDDLYLIFMAECVNIQNGEMAQVRI